MSYYEKRRPTSSPGTRSGTGEHIQAHRCGVGQLPGGGALQDAQSVQERLLRLAGQTTFEEESTGCPPQPRRSTRSIREAAKPTASRGCMPSYVRSGLSAEAGGLLG